MLRKRGLPALAIAVAVLAACGSDDSADGDEATDAPISAEAYYEQMQVGDFATYDREGLDTIGEAFCESLPGLPDDMEPTTAVIAVRESVSTDVDAFQAAYAMTARHCPEFRDDFDLDELEVD